MKVDTVAEMLVFAIPFMLSVGDTTTAIQLVLGFLFPVTYDHSPYTGKVWSFTSLTSS